MEETGMNFERIVPFLTRKVNENRPKPTLQVLNGHYTKYHDFGFDVYVCELIIIDDDEIEKEKGAVKVPDDKAGKSMNQNEGSENEAKI